ncbi:MAG: BlaI/MecI/CopY family transcriptional regulator [Acidobacteriota bacterium]
MRLSDAEWIVMNAVWDRPVESSVRDVLEVVEPQTSWAYQTVQTIMVRLAQKKALRSRLRANTRLYTALITREQAQRSALKSLIEKAFAGAAGPLVQALVSEEYLTPVEKKQVAELLERDMSEAKEAKKKK